MPNDSLLSITPIDGRYQSKTSSLADFFSEFALIRTRVEVEIKWLLFLSKNKSIKFIPEISSLQNKKILKIFDDFSLIDAKQIKKIEKITNHDVKAVELFIVNKLKKLNIRKLCEFVHFGCTSEDINNLSYALMLDRYINLKFLTDVSSCLLYTSPSPRDRG